MAEAGEPAARLSRALVQHTRSATGKRQCDALGVVRRHRRSEGDLAAAHRIGEDDALLLEPERAAGGDHVVPGVALLRDPELAVPELDLHAFAVLDEKQAAA